MDFPETQTVATLQMWLAQAEKSYQELMLGQQARVYVDQNGERMEFTSVSAGRLQGYILELKTRISRAQGIGGLTVSGPLRFVF